MEKLIAHVKATIKIEESVQDWFLDINSINDSSVSNTNFLIDILEIEGKTIDDEFLEVSRKEIRRQFGLIISEEEMDFPRIKIIESYKGSWVIDAAVYLIPKVSTVYSTAKGISKLPEIYEGLSDLKQRITKHFSTSIEKLVKEKIQSKSEKPLSDNQQKFTKVSLNFETVNDVNIDTKNTYVSSSSLITKIVSWSAFVGVVGLSLLFWRFESNSDYSQIEKKLTYMKSQIIELNSELSRMEGDSYNLKELNLKLDNMQKEINILKAINAKHIDIIKAANDRIETLSEQKNR